MLKKVLIITLLGLAAFFATKIVQPTNVPVAVAATAAKTTTAKSTTPFYYGVWLPYWQDQAGASDISINLDKLHEVSPFSYELNTSGALIDSLNISNGSWAPWFSAVHDAGVKIIPTIAWFNTQGIYNLLSNTKARQATEDRIASLVKTNNFDGIDIDFESMSAATRPYYSLFIEGLAMRLHPAGDQLTCTVVPRTPLDQLYPNANAIPDNVTYAENYPVLNQNCDEVRVMAYDQETVDLTLDAAKGNGTLYAPVADPSWVSSVLQETLKYISPKKVMLGIPTYGYEYQVSWTGGITTYERVRAFDYMDAMDRADSLGIEPTRDNGDELSFTYASTTHIDVPSVLVSTVFSAQPPQLMTIDPNASTTFFVSFPDAQSIQDEITLAKQFGIRGAMLFKADGNIDPLAWQYMQ